MQVVASTQTSNPHDPKSVNASYSRISEAFRHVTAGPLQCQVFCGGKSCKYERSDVWASDQMAIPGIFSHWVTENILAMARPNYTEMKNHDMIQSFKKSGITAVINLQEAGEHASCGNALHASGFSYDPIEFMDNEIYYYNFNIQDYSVPLQRTLLDICKVVTFAQSEGKVAIHCHAGLGRTGVVIACFLVYHHKMKPKDAILLVRKNRPRSIQTRNQLKAVFRFANFLSPLWIQFPASAPRGPGYNLEEIIANQKIVLHGIEGKTLKYIPKVVYLVCSWLMEQVGQSPSLLYKKIKQNHEIHRPVTCPSSYQKFDVEENDIDSLVGDECSVQEVEEMEKSMSTTLLRRARSEESLSKILPAANPYGETTSILELHNISDETLSSIKEFLEGVSGKNLEKRDGESDLEMVISQINVGIWESTSTLSPFQRGCLLRAWFTSISKPVLSELEVEALLRKCDIRVRDEGETTPKYLERLANALDTLSPCLVATIHCLGTAFAMLKRGEVFSILRHLLTQKNDDGTKRMVPILTALLYSKRNEILRLRS
ncbi:hypothetical protein ACHWQZ_G009110 [Mnemiopsis leidyi]